MKLTDYDEGKTRECERFGITTSNERHNIANAGSSHYSLEFKFRRSQGRKGFKLLFGERDEKNFIIWEFGGWDNWDCNISSFKNGRASTISHRIFHVTDEEYQLKLEIDGRRIITYVNGELRNDTVDRLPELEELYAAASKDGCGRTIVKLVNLTGDEKNTVVDIEGDKKSSVTIHSLSDCAFSAENTFEQPDMIKPAVKNDEVVKNEYLYNVKPHSVNVLIFE